MSIVVRMDLVPDFDKLPEADAYNIVNGEVVATCDAKRVLLSDYGNCNSYRSLVSEKEYFKQRDNMNLFHVERIQKVFADLDQIVRPFGRYETGSYGLKHRVEEYQNEYVTNGDTIVAMLLKGYPAKFNSKQDKSPSVNCTFKARVIV